jgi:uncharacterized SAM-binding protein YcdF (DUF218 family)
MKQLTDDELAKTLWNYNYLVMPVEKADLILVLGSNDIRVAERGAKLFLAEFAPLILFSGNLGALTTNLYQKPEAEVFADIAKKMGVPEEKILIEDKSTNTGDNIIYTKKLLLDKGIKVSKIILVQKPYMLRRAYATFRKQWPEMDFIVTSPEISFKNYPNEKISKNLLINIMVGDTQRIREYPKKGFQIEQRIPEEVWSAYEELVKRGYTNHLI